MLTVTTPATNFDLISLATAKTALKISDHSADAFLKATISQASDVIARHCKRVFALETVSEQFRLDRHQLDLVLSRCPVVEITSITEGDTTLAATDYEINMESGIVSRLHGDRPCHWSRQKIIVTYRAGYDLPADTPDALAKAVTRLVQAYWYSAARDLTLRKEEVPGVFIGMYLDFEHLPFDAKGLLEPFCNMRVG